MALSEDEKTRIREEELLRLQTREEFRIMQHRMRPKDRMNAVVFLIIFAIAFAGMWMLVKSTKEKRRQGEFAPAATVRLLTGC